MFSLRVRAARGAAAQADGETAPEKPSFQLAWTAGVQEHSRVHRPSMTTAPHLAMRGRWKGFAQYYLGWLMGYKTAT
jgi:hypothetical protein